MQLKQEKDDEERRKRKAGERDGGGGDDDKEGGAKKSRKDDGGQKDYTGVSEKEMGESFRSSFSFRDACARDTQEAHRQASADARRAETWPTRAAISWARARVQLASGWRAKPALSALRVSTMLNVICPLACRRDASRAGAGSFFFN